METRVLIAYFLIGLLLAAASLLLRYVVIAGRKRRRLRRGFRHYKHAERR